MHEPQPSFYAIIPATVRYNKNLEPHAKLVYAEITALANLHGYCWAKNEYFAELYDVEVRTVKNWLKSLQKEKLIKVDLDRTCFPPQRKIWVTPEVQKIFTSGKKFPHHQEKNFPPNNTSEYEKKNHTKRKPKNAAPPITYNEQTRRLEGITDEEVKQWQAVYTSVNVRKEIDKCAIWAANNGRQNYRKSLMSFFANAEKAHTTPFKAPPEPSKEVTQEDVAKNKKIALELEERALAKALPMHYHVSARTTKIEFVMPEGQGYDVEYAMPHEEFKKKCFPAVKRMKLMN